MIRNKKVLGVIPARGGSKGLPRKNLRLAGGKPLLAWTIEAAARSKYLDRFVLSSEDEEIIALARRLGCEVPFVRPAELAGDDVSAVDPVIHALREMPGYDYVVLLQPTTPLRTAEDIDGCIAICYESKAGAVISVVNPQKSPFWMLRKAEDGFLLPLISENFVRLQRQELPEVFLPNGAVYVSEREYLLNNRSFLADRTLGYSMPRERSIDIDTEMDLVFFEMMINRFKIADQNGCV